MAFSMGFPVNDNGRLEQLAAGFRQHSGGLLDGCIWVLDGFGVRVCCPFVNDALRQKDYRFQKLGFAIVVLAGTDIDGRFICATASRSGNTNDMKAWEDTSLYQFLEIQRGLPEPYFFIGDETFTNTSQFLSPWPDCGLDCQNDSYNYWLSHSCQCVEQAFGMLMQHWGFSGVH